MLSRLNCMHSRSAPTIIIRPVEVHSWKCQEFLENLRIAIFHIITVVASNDNLEVQNAVHTSDPSERAKWQVGLFAGACACIVVLIINLGVNIWPSVSLKGNDNGEKSSGLTLISGLGWEDKGDKRLIANVLLANLPQLVFSFLYFQYNSVFTCMAAAAEWSSYGNRRRSLRVSSNPRGEQRSRYFLQLPYRYSVPLLLASILMHWMLSQSIFIVAVEQSGIWKLFTCGYSPIAIIFVIITAIFMAAAVIIIALRRLPTAMPVVASCSLAIAAACHHPDNIPQPEASMFPLQLGVMWRQREGSGRELTDHCGFSQYPVERPGDGIVYR